MTKNEIKILNKIVNDLHDTMPVQSEPHEDFQTAFDSLVQFVKTKKERALCKPISKTEKKS